MKKQQDRFTNKETNSNIVIKIYVTKYRIKSVNALQKILIRKIEFASIKIIKKYSKHIGDLLLQWDILYFTSLTIQLIL